MTRQCFSSRDHIRAMGAQFWDPLDFNRFPKRKISILVLGSAITEPLCVFLDRYADCWFAHGRELTTCPHQEIIEIVEVVDGCRTTVRRRSL